MTTPRTAVAPSPVTEPLPRARPTSRRVPRMIGRRLVRAPTLVLDQPLMPLRPRPPLAATALTILAALLLGFVGYLLLLSPIAHARAQSLGYAELRDELANGVAPLGQTRDGALLPLGSPVALLELPGTGVREVVREGTTASVLAEGPGHRRDSVLPGQPGTTVIFGRRAAYGGPFGRITELTRGRVIVLTTGQGRHDYRVTGVRRAGDPVPVAAAAGTGRLTLVTATGPPFLPTGTVRVEAELTSPVQPVAPRVLTGASTSRAEKPMQGDPAALVPLLLWTQGLLVVCCGFVWARTRWGPRQSWLVGVPLLTGVGVAVATYAARLLPNLM